jgi:hypothetical protein
VANRHRRIKHLRRILEKGSWARRSRHVLPVVWGLLPSGGWWLYREQGRTPYKPYLSYGMWKADY